MTLKNDLLHRFDFNDWANRNVIRMLPDLNDPAEAVRLMSHLISSQEKWLARIRRSPLERSLKWFDDPFPLPELESKWSGSVREWRSFLEKTTEEELFRPFSFISTEGHTRSSSIYEIATQLNFHSVHHRAQILRILREQGVIPPLTDYLFFSWEQKGQSF